MLFSPAIGGYKTRIGQHEKLTRLWSRMASKPKSGSEAVRWVGIPLEGGTVACFFAIEPRPLIVAAGTHAVWRKPYVEAWTEPMHEAKAGDVENKPGGPNHNAGDSSRE